MQNKKIGLKFLALLLTFTIAFVSVPIDLLASGVQDTPYKSAVTLEDIVNELDIEDDELDGDESEGEELEDEELEDDELEDDELEDDELEYDELEDDELEDDELEDDELEDDELEDEELEDEELEKLLPELPILPSENFISIYISFEGYTLGHGFYIEPTIFSVPEGSTIEHATLILLEDSGFDYTASDKNSPFFELVRINGFDPFYSNPPDFILDELRGLNSGSGDGSLGSGDYSDFSRWMLTLNHNLISSPGSYILNDGDVLRWQFSLLDGADLGVHSPFAWPLYEHIDKSELIRALYSPWATFETRQHALDIIIDPIASSYDVEYALLALMGIVGLAAPLSLASPQAAMTDAARWLTANVANPGFNNEWAVLAVARGEFQNADWYGRYISSLNDTLSGGTVGSIIDYARVTLALSALGLNAQDYYGRDLTAEFSTFPGGAQTVNTYIFALLALDSGSYHGSRGQLNSLRQQYIDAIIAAQESGGYWNPWAGFPWGAPDPDTTSQAIQAMAPYSSQPNVQASMDAALSWLSNEQTSSGGWVSWGNYSTETAAQVIVALTSLGINPQADSRFIKNGGNPVTALLSLQDQEGSGGFTADWGSGRFVDLMSTEQAAYALVAYHRFLNNMNPLFDMSDAANISITLPDGSQPGTPGLPGGPSGPVVGRAFISVRDDNAGPGNTSLFFEGYIDIQNEETVYSLLHKTGLDVVSRGGYVAGIGGLAEFDAGPFSGWVFSINGQFPGTGATNIPVNEGDRIEWLFTRDLGADVGAGGEFGEGGLPLIPQIAQDQGGEGSIVLTIYAEITEGVALANISDELVLHITQLALQEGLAEIVISVTITEDAHRVEVSLSTESLILIAENNLRLTISSNIASIAIDEAALSGIVFDLLADPDFEELSVQIIAEAIDNYSMLNEAQQEIVGEQPVTYLAITVGELYIREFEGSITVTLPYALQDGDNLSLEIPGLLSVYHIDNEANIKEMEGSFYLNGEITFSTDHFSLFFISEWINPFADIAGSEEFNLGLRFLYNAGLISSTEDDSLMSDTNISRAELVQLIWYLAGEPDTTMESPFIDVNYSEHYAAITWAWENTIVRGRGNGFFNPLDYVTFEELAVIFYNYAAYLDLELSNALTDTFLQTLPFADTVSDWALDAFIWAYASGLFESKDDDSGFTPNNHVSLYQSAVIFHRFMWEMSDEEEE